MSVNINLHNVVEVRIEKIDELEAESRGKEHIFYTRDIVIVQEDGTELTLDLFSNKHSNLIPVFKTEED